MEKRYEINGKDIQFLEQDELKYTGAYIHTETHVVEFYNTKTKDNKNVHREKISITKEKWSDNSNDGC